MLDTANTNFEWNQIQRGEGTASATGGDLLANANATMQKEMDAEARAKLDAARTASNNGSAGGVMLASGKLASENSAAKGKLATPSGTPAPTPPPSGGLLKPVAPSGGSRLILRKPATSTASSRLLKKSSSVASSKLRVNKLSSSNVGDDAFEDVETTQKAIEDQKKQEEDDKKRQQEEDEKMAQKLQDEMNGLNVSNGSTHVPATPTSTPASGIAVAAEPPKAKMSAMEENMAKLSAMNSDFFSGM